MSLKKIGFLKKRFDKHLQSQPSGDVDIATLAKDFVTRYSAGRRKFIEERIEQLRAECGFPEDVETFSDLEKLHQRQRKDLEILHTYKMMELDARFEVFKAKFNKQKEERRFVFAERKQKLLNEQAAAMETILESESARKLARLTAELAKCKEKPLDEAEQKRLIDQIVVEHGKRAEEDQKRREFEAMKKREAEEIADEKRAQKRAKCDDSSSDEEDL